MAALALLAGFIPVVLLLAGMMVMDCYKLVSRSAVLRSVLFGGVAAVVAWAAHLLIRQSTSVTDLDLKRWIAPVLEEALKASWIVFLTRRGRIGFLVDAGIHGFAVGTGFAVVENLYYASMLRNAGVMLWLVRGLGTAIMHGGATAIAAILARDLTERHGSTSVRWFLPGLALAIVVHGFFNQLPLSPLITTACVIVVVPLILIVAYELSERQTRHWLGATMERDLELLELIHSGAITGTPVGRHLASLQEHFPGPVVGDMLCLLEIHAELALRATGVLLARGGGVELPPDADLETRLREMRFLEQSIGRTGLLAIASFLEPGSRGHWRTQMLESRARGSPPGRT